MFQLFFTWCSRVVNLIDGVIITVVCRTVIILSDLLFKGSNLTNFRCWAFDISRKATKMYFMRLEAEFYKSLLNFLRIFGFKKNYGPLNQLIHFVI